jgi:ribosome-associated protein
MIENKPISKEKNILEFVFKGMQEKKARHIVNIDMGGIANAVCSNFVICHAESKRQVEAIADAVMEFVKTHADEKPWHKEGFENAEWILLDYADVVVHIFNQETRKFYNLEQLWADAEITTIED